MNDLQGWTTKDAEGQESMRRARETLRPGDVIRYVYDRCPLLLVIAIIQTSEYSAWSHVFYCIRLAFRDGASRSVEFALHGEWELLGHIDNWHALVEEEPCLSHLSQEI